MKKLIILISIAVWMAAAGVALADDTAIYGSGAINVQPNVLIIFDTSGSMGTQDVPGEYYDPATTYAGTYSPNVVYSRSWWSWSYSWFADSISDLNCASVESALSTDGYVTSNVNSGPTYGCGGWNRTLRLGNWLNYDQSTGGAMRTRIDVAQEVITNLINDTDGVRFGLMRFNTWEGGRLTTHGQCGSTKADLIADINALTASGMTPLAETLTEAGLYFAGKTSWYNSGVSYTSPLQYRCQKNFVIFMTDGEPTADDDPRLDSEPYVNAAGDPIGDYDGDGSSLMYRLDDVSKYLYENDLDTTLGSTDDFEVQNVKTYTVGFLTNQQLLQDTADDQHGRGKYYTTSSISGLEASLKEIMMNINEVNTSYVSPVVPVSRMNQIYSGDYMYVGFFNPQGDGFWFGNVKKYGLDANGNITDASGAPAVDGQGMILETSRSFWSTTADGYSVNKGGAGEVVLNQASRNIYTKMIGAGTSNLLTNPTNAFSKSNAAIDYTLLDVADSAARDAVIDDVHGVGKTWILGDILHSEPAIVHYGGTKTVIYVGSNDGMLHCIDDDDGSELWAYIPYELLPRLKELSDGNSTHAYFMDGYPVLYDNGSQKILLVGERRGGDYYYALDVTDYAAPKYLYSVGPNHLGGGAATLGQSWGRAQIANISTGAGSETVFLLPGGYDENQDLASPLADTKGRAVFSVSADTGTVGAFRFSAANFANMSYSILDAVAIDPDNDGLTNRIYVPDLGGQVFAFQDDDKNGSWAGVRLFSASQLDGVQRKIFYAPDIVKIDAQVDGGQEMIFFGTGDRADPEETGVVNRFYGVKNNWSTDFENLNENDLRNVSADLIQMGTAQQKEDEETYIQNAKGWFFELEDPGEKAISAPIVYAGVVYFTTFVPDSGPAVSDPCETERGMSYLYAVDYKTGCAVYPDFYQPDETDGDGQVVDKGKQDRRMSVGKGIASTPIISVFEGHTEMYVMVEGGIKKIDPITKYDMNMYYWRDR